MLLSAWALALFIFGALLFATRRGLAWWPSLAEMPLAGWLPSFIHTHVFVLLVCIWLARSWWQALWLGLGFWTIDVTMELLQHTAVHRGQGIGSVQHGWLQRWLGSTFDPLDIAAATLGLLAAWAAIWAGSHLRGKHNT